jgi:predicted transcriptional regulator
MTVGDYKDQDDFILVRRFMSTELGIQSKNEMLLYALIYSYSDGGSAFYGSTEYLAKRLGSSKSRIIKVLNEMVSKGLIIKKTSGRFNFYVTNFNYVCNTDEPPVSVEHPERCHIDTESSVTPTPNNINNNINNNITAKRFVKPTVEEVRAYCKERNNNVDAEKFISHYDSNGWKVGKTPMKDWKGAVRTWEKNDYGYHNKTVSEEPPKPQFNFIKAEGYEGAPTMCPRCNTRFIRNGGMVICNNCHIWYEKEDGLWKMYKRGS